MADLSNRAMLVNLTIKFCTFAKHDKRVSRQVAVDNGSDVQLGRFYKDLLVRKENNPLDKLQSIAGMARNTHYSLTLPWLDNGARICAAELYFKYGEKMRPHQDDWAEQFAKFKEQYPTMIEQAKRSLNGLFDPNEYPSLDKVDSKFFFGYSFFPLPMADDFRVKLRNGEEDSIKRSIEANLEQTLETAATDVYQRVQKVVSHVVEGLSKYQQAIDEGVEDRRAGRFSDSLVEHVEELVDVLPKFNSVINNQELTQLQKDMKKQLCRYSAQDLRDDDSARKQVMSAADEILKKMGVYIGA